MSRCVKECEEDEPLHPVIALINSDSVYSAMFTKKNDQRNKKWAGMWPRRNVGITTKKRYMKKKAEVDSFDRRVILTTMEDFYRRQKLLSSVKKLLAVITQRVVFLWQKGALIRVLHDVDSTWKLLRACWKSRYYRLTSLIFNDDVWDGSQLVDDNLTSQKFWQRSEIQAAVFAVSGSSRIIVVHNGSKSVLYQGLSWRSMQTVRVGITTDIWTTETSPIGSHCHTASYS